MAKGSGTTRRSTPSNPRGLSGNGMTYRDQVLGEVDDYFGFESNGEFVEWNAKMAFATDNEIEDFIDQFTEYFVESVGGRGDYTNVGYGRDIRTQTTFNVIPKGTPDGDEDVFRKSVVVDEDTEIGDIFRQLGYQSRRDRRRY